MAISKARKEELVAQYKDLIEQSRAIILTEYGGMSVKEMEGLRAKVREVDGAFFVTKNTLLKLALEEAGRPVPEELLLGQVATGFAMGEIPSLAKALVDYAKDADKLSVKGGMLEVEMLTADQIKALAELPSLDQLRAQIIGLINAPAQGIASTVTNGIRQVINVVDAYARSEEAAATEGA